MINEQNNKRNSERNQTPKSLIIGITGGICTGKTAVANIIKEMGYTVLSSDERAKILMHENNELKNKLIEIFGSDIYIEGQINKPFLSNLIFSTTDEGKKSLEKLNSIVHPYVIQDLIVKTEEYIRNGERLIFNESALIYEAELDEGFDYIIVVDADIEIRKQRALTKGLTLEQFENRVNSQIAQEDKCQAADFVISNNATFDELKSATQMIVNILEMM